MSYPVPALIRPLTQLFGLPLRGLGLGLSLVAIAIAPACSAPGAESGSLWKSMGTVVSPLLSANRTPIGSLVQSDPATLTPDSTVYVEGEIVAIAPLLTGQMYQVRDRTGQIWVVSPAADLRVGDRVVIEGAVQYESIPLGGQERGELYLEEQQRLDHSPAAV